VSISSVKINKRSDDNSHDRRAHAVCVPRSTRARVGIEHMTNAKGFDDFGLDARSVLEHGFPSTFLKSRMLILRLCFCDLMHTKRAVRQCLGAFLYTQAGKVKMNESNWYRVEARVQKAVGQSALRNGQTPFACRLQARRCSSRSFRKCSYKTRTSL
jgi:hypothetical protein